MTGRARGRARGRGRSGPPAEAPRRPGGQAAAPPAASRGRSRGATPAAPPAASAAPAPTPQASAAPPTEAMAAMSVTERPAGRRYTQFQEIESRPQWCVDKCGSSGQKIPMVTNYFKLNSKPGGMIYQYNVSYNPEVDNKKVRVAMINGQNELLGKPRAFDGMVLFMPRKLAETVTKVVTHRKSDDQAVEITITLTNEIPASSPSCMQLYNIIFRRILSMMDMKQIQRHYFKTDSPIPIPKYHLELWPGFITSILQYEKNIMLCAEVSHKVLRKETVLEFLYDLHGKVRQNQNFYDEATKRVVGEIVLTRYNNKTYRVDDIKWDGKPSDTFKLYDGSEITFAEYYQKTYSKVVQDPDQPLLVTKPKKRFGPGGVKADDRPCYLLPELCYMTGLSDEMRSDFHLMRDLATHTRVGPQERNDSLQKFMNDMRSNPDCSNELSGWGLEFDKNLLGLGGRVLPPEEIHQKNTKYMYKPATAEWSREMRDGKLISTIPLHTWMLLFTSRDGGIAQDFLQALIRVCGPMGIEVSKPMMCELRDDKTETYLRTIQEKMTDNVSMVTCILPTNRKDRYDAIKKFCCVTRPVSSQVIVSRTLAKKQMLMSVATKIGIQLNCKLGGEVWAVDFPFKAPLMVIGIDCYHDSVSKGKSISGFVASTNQSLTRYYSRCTSQHTGQELVDGIKVCVTGALRRYNEINNCLPERIIVFRDGVGDGQLGAVYEHEVKQFMECFKTVGFQEKPKFAFVVVKKRINTRFFMKNGRLQNPPPGSVVDTQVTRKEWYDFFLVSQSVRQGTVTPTHYNVIYDTSGFKPDHMQRLTYKLTHLYYNWPGTIRVPAPCQYAHKLAYLVGTSIHTEPDISLADRLYYL